MLDHKNRLRAASGFVFLVTCSWGASYLAAPPVTAAGTRRAARAKAVLAMDGPGGKVAIGDSLEQAKRAFPAPRGAVVGDAANYAILGRPGWSWATEKPTQAFEVSLKNGKIAGIIRTVEAPNAGTRQRIIAQSIQKLGPPNSQARGKTTTMYAWAEGPHARFVFEMQQSFMSNTPVMMIVVGEQSELKLFNYRVDDVATTVKQMDMAAEAMKKYRKKKR